MLPGADRLHEGLQFFVRRRGLNVEISKPLIAAALVEARTLAAGEAHVEPAALFYACGRRSRAFGGASALILPFLVQGQARAVGLELTVEPDGVELILLRLRVVRGEILFDELRAWFAERLRPAS